MDVNYGGFTIKTDQAPQSGGEGSAPEPFTYFLASLAACAGIYVLRFCRKRNIPTEGLKLYQRTERDPSGKRPLSKIEIEIVLPPDFPEKYKDAVIKSAEHCAMKPAMDNLPNLKPTPR